MTGDATDEPDETVVVTLGSASGATVGTGTGTGTITDDDAAPTVTLAVADDSISENGGSTTVSATLSHPSSEATTITIEAVADAYTVGADATITIAAGDTANATDTAAITAVDNGTDEANRSVTVTGSASNTQGVGSVTGASLTLIDDDGDPSLTINSPSVTEGDSGSVSLTYTVTLSPVDTEEVTVDYAEGMGATATAGTDYTALASGTLTFAIGDTSKTITVSVTGDTTDEPDETVVVTLGNASGATIGSGTGTGTITDDDAAPTVTLAVADDSISENGGSTTVSATLSHPSSAATTITITALADAYTVGADGTITIAAGNIANASDTAAITAVDNATDEANRSVTVTGSASNTQGVGSVTGASLTLIDDDGDPSLTINSPSVTEGDSGSVSLTYTVTLSPVGTEEVTVDYADGTGTAASGTDYTAITGGTLTFAVGETSETITVSVTGDTLDEADETVVVTLSDAANATITTATGTGTITDDDPEPSLSINSPSVAEGDSGSKDLEFTVTLSAASGKQVTVDWAEGTGGAATSGTDYTAITGGTLTFAAGATSQTFDVSVTGDTLDEADETVVVTLGNAANATIGTATGTGTITDNDPEPSLSINSPNVTEGDSGSKNLTFTVTLSAASGKRVTVDYGYTGGGTATPGTDFTAIADGTLTFAAGTTSQTFNVSVTGDTDGERNETLRVTLSNATNATISTATGTGTITDDDAPHSVSLDSPTVEERNSGSRMLAFTLKLSRAHAQTVFAYLRDAGTGTATPGTDYTAFLPQWVRLDPGETEKTVSISVTGDTVKEPNETVVLEIIAVWRDLATIPTPTRFGTGTITDDDSTPGLSISSPRVTEGNSGSATLTYAVTLSVATTGQVTVSWADAGTGTATSGTDYTAITGGTLTFSPGDTRKNITVSVTGDTTVEPHETVAVRLSNPSGATILTATGTGTIANDDGASSIAISSPTVVEGTGGPSQLRFTVTLSRARSQAVVVDLRDSLTGTASPGRDYADFRGSHDVLQFAPGEVSKTFDLAVVADSRDEPNETVVLLATEVSSGQPGVTGTGTITDDDPTPTLSIDSPSVNEGDSSTRMLNWTVSLSAESGREVTVAYAQGTGGTATSGTDHTALAGGTLTFAPGDTEKTFGVSVNGDTDEEPNETVVATLSSATNATLSTATGTGTIVNDDGVLVSIDSPSVTEGDSGSTTMTFTVNLSTASTGQVTVDYADAGTGTAASGTDYTAIAGGTLTFAAGTTSQTFTVSVTGDTVDEGDETLLVTLSNASAGATISTATGTGTITDNDGAPTLSMDSPSVAEGDSGSKNLTYTVTLSPASGQRVTVDYADTETGTALAGVDYTTVTGGSLTFEAGTTTRTFAVSVIGDTLSEADETILVSLGSPTNATVSSTAGTGTGTITDDETPSTLSISSPSINEGNSGSKTLTYAVTLSPASGQEVTVDWAEGTGGTATSGTDYTAITGGSLTFAAGTTRREITVSVTGDTTEEPNETVVVTLSNASGATIATGTGTATIVNDDGYLLSMDSPSVTEGDSGSADLTFTVTLSAAKSQQVTVAYADAGTGTATSGTDYTAITAGVLTFAANETSKTITVSVTGDASDEDDETVEVTLSGAVGATISTATGTGTITDNDGEPTLSIGSPSVVEGNSGSATLTWTVTLSPASGKQVTVNYADAGTGTATSGTDYTAITAGTLTFDAGTTSRTFDVSVTGDTDLESNETILVSLSSPTNAAVSSTAGTGTGTITDDDGTPSFSISSPSVVEGNSGSATLTYAVTLFPASTEQLRVRFSDAGTGTATAGTDYPPFRLQWLRFAAGETRKTVSVAVTGDTVKEPNETVVAELFLASQDTGVTLGTRYGTGTITDDDTTPGLSISSPQVTEGNSGSATLTYEVTLTAAITGQVTVSYADAGTGTATSGTDYTAITAGTLTFAAGTTSQTFDVSVTGDTTVEPHETVVARLSNASGATILTVTGVGTIANDDGASTLSISSPTVTEPTVTEVVNLGSSAPMWFTVTLGAVRSQSVRVYWWDTGTGTATAGSDYIEPGVTTPGSRWLTFGAGEVSKTVEIRVRDDNFDESDETIVLAVSEAANGQPRVTGTGTIKDDNDHPPTVSIDSPSVTEGDDGSVTLTYTVGLTGASGREVTVDYADAGTGTATSGTDYTAITGGTLTFAAGTLGASATFDVSVTGDTVDEPDETILVALSNPTNATVSTTAGTGTGTINDDDPPAMSIDSPTVTEGGADSTVTLKFTVSLSSASDDHVSVNIADLRSGTATRRTDYRAWGPTSFSFSPGETTKTLDVTVNGDEVDEADETIVARLSSPVNATIAVADGTGTITDDDPSPTVSINTPTVDEGDTGSTTMTYTVTLDPASGQQVTVDYEDAGTGTATSGTDYEAISKGTLTFTAGDTSETFDVSLTGDTLDEDHETVLVTLSNPTNATVSSTAGTGTGTITDDDGVPTLSISSPSVNEGDDGSATLTYTVSLSTESGKQVTVQYADAGTGTATSGTDFTAITGGTLTFAAGTTSQTFDVSVTGDVLDESNETILVSLSTPTNAVVSTTTGTGTGTITDDDATPTSITLTVDEDSVGEGDRATTITVTATVDGTTRFAEAKTVSVSVAGSGTATAVDFAAVTAFDIEIAAGAESGTETFTLTPTDDAVDETDETITVSGTSSGLTVNPDTITLTDDDAAPTAITLTVDDDSVGEGDGATTITVKAAVDGSTRFATAKTVRVSVAGSGTATAVDFAAVTDFNITIAAGEASKTGTFTLTPTDDAVDETNETITVGGTLSGLTVNPDTISLTDDDAAPTAITLTVDDSSVGEGDGATTITVKATVDGSTRFATAKTVRVSVAGSGAATAVDFAAVAAFDIEIAAEAESETETFTLTPTDDTADETDETITVRGTSSGLTVNSATISLTDDDAEPELSISSPSVNEGDSGSANLTFTVSLSPASGKEVTVQYADATTGTATSGDDYTAITGGTLTFAAGDTSETFDVSVTGDVLDESNETVKVSLSGPTNATISSSAGTGTGTITDDDAAPTSITLTVSDNSVGEGDGATSITVTATVDGTTRFATAKTVTVSVAGSGTATAVDFAAVSDFDITIAAGEASGTESFTLTPTADTVDETNETVTVSGTSGSLAVTSATITLTDDDGAPSSITLTVDDNSVGEGDGATTITVTATVDGATRFATAKTVSVSVAGSGTASAVDFAAVTNFNITIAAGEASGTERFTLTPTDDTVDETDETITVSGTSTGLTVTSATITLTDDDAEPELSIDSPSVNEGDSGSVNLRFTVSLDAASGKQVTVQYADATTGTAISGTDYTAIAGGTLTFAAGETSKTFDVSVTGDTTDEANETVLVTLSGATNATIGTATGTGTITDDDGAPTVTLALSPTSITESGATNASTVTATLNRASGQATTITVSAAAGTNTAAGDFTLSSATTLTIAAGATTSTGTVTITAVDNSEDEADKSVTVSGSATNSQGVTDPSSVTLTITDDDAEPELSIDSPSVNEGDTGSATLRFTVSLDAASGKQVTVQYADATTGTAISGTDYTAIAGGTLTFAAGETSKTFDVSVTGDTTDEANETVLVTLSGATNATIGTATGTGTITDDDGAPTVTLALSPTSITESGATNASTVTATLNRASGQATTITVSAAAGTNADSSDFTVSSNKMLTIAAGATTSTGTVTITAVDNAEDEPDKSVTVSGTAMNNQGITAPSSVTLTITDDDAEPELSIDSPSVTEGDSGSVTLRFTVSLDAASGKQVKVRYSDAGTGTATSGTDYTAITSAELTFAAGTTSQTFDVSVTGDTTDEANETVLVTLSSPTNATVSSSAGTGTGTITDDDGTPTVTLALSPTSITESGAANASTVTATLNRASGQATTITVSAAAGTNAVAGDFTLSSATTLTIAAGATTSTGTVTITAVDNAEDELDKSVTVSGSAANSQGVTDPSDVTLTITDDDAEPELSIDSPSVTEGDTGSVNLTFTVSLDAASGKQVTVAYADATTGTATSGTDYTAIAGGTLTFAAGETSKTFDVSVTGDTTDEANETVLVTLSGAANATIGTATGTGTITDDDGAPTVTLALSPTSIAESGATNASTVTATLNRASGQATTITVSAAAGTNAAAGDFTLSSATTLTIAAGSTTSTGTVTITAVDNSEDEPDKSVTVSGSATNSQGVTDPSDVTLTITDDDAEPELSISSPSVTEGDTGSATLTFTVSLDAASGKQVTVQYADATTGTATSGTDYTAIAGGTLTFAAGETSKTFDVSVTGDTTDEANETVLVTLSGAANATIGTATGTGTITDDDGAPTVTLVLSPTSITESGATNASTVTATLNRASGQATTITVSAAAGTNAVAGDFTLSSATTLTIAAGATTSTGTVTITAVDNAEDEADKSVTVSGSATNNQGITDPSDVTLTITDDDAEPELSIDSPSVTEGDSGSVTLRFTVSLDAASGKQVKVRYSDAGTGTATSGTDYTAITSAELTFAAGTTSQTFDVSVTGDTTDEANETVLVTLSSPTSATIGTATGTGTITDDDGAPTVTLVLSPTSITESGATNASTVTATLNRASGQATTITVSAAAGTNAEATDFTLSSATTLTIAAGSTTSTGTVTITAVDNSEDEPDKSVTVSGSAANSQGVTDPSDVTLTITDDDAEPALSIDSPSVTEGDTGSVNLTFTVSLDAASGKQVTVAYADATTGTATSGDDYTAIAGGTLTFAAGETSKTFDVSVTGDTTDEANETVLVTLSGAANATIGTATGTGTITDDDGAPTVTLALSPTSIAESGATNASTVTATLNRASGQATTITVSAAAGTNAAAGDFTLSSATTLTIAAGATTSTGTVTITAVDNSEDEPDKSVTVSGSATNSQGVTDPSSVTLTITDDDAEPELSIDSPSVTEGDTGSVNLTFTVSLDAASGKQVTVAYADATTGTATSGTDYTAITGGTLTFAAGETSKTFDVSVTGDTTDEANETVLVTLSSPTNATISSSAGTGTGTITDDDGAPTVTLALSPTSITESGATNASTVTATLNRASGQATTITVSAVAGTNAAAGDFTLSSATTLTIAAGATTSTGTVTITAVDNSEDEPDKSVTVSGTAANSQGVTDPSSVTLTITDDDAEPELSIDSPSVNEGDSGSANLEFTVSLDAASGKQVTVQYADATTGTATSGTDYTAITGGTLTFAAGVTSQTITVSVTGDTTDEANETVAVTLSSPTNATVSSSAGTGTGTITDDDGQPTVTLALSPTSITESGATNASTVTATLNRASGQATTITVSAAAGTNADSSDFTLSSATTLTIAAGSTTSTGTVTITAVDNSEDELDKSVTVSGTAANSQGVTDPSDVTLTITDDDAEPELSISSPSVNEGDSGTANLEFTVSLDAASGKQVTVQYADATTGTATSGTDYTAITGGTLTFAAGDTSKSFDVSVTGDVLDESNETILVSLSAATNAAVSTTAGTGTGTITDDDGTPTSITLTVDDDSVGEGDGATTIAVTAAVDGTTRFTDVRTVQVSVAGTGTAKAVDFVAVPAFDIEIAAGAASQTGSFTLTPMDDAEEETDETITVSGTSSGLTIYSDSIRLTDDDDPDEPTPDEPTPDDPTPDDPTEDDPTEDPAFKFVVSDRTYREGSVIEPLRLPELVGASASVSYSFAPAPPAGLVLDLAGRTITGTPTTPQPAREYRWTATEPGGEAVTDTFRITVLEDHQPSFDAGRFGEFRFPVGREITPQELPPAAGGDGRLTYAVTPALPPGLTFAPGSLTFSGTPTEVRERTVHVLTATDEDGDTASLSFAITVLEDRQPSFDAGRFEEFRFRVGSEITPQELPSAVGGDGRLTYAVTPVLPPGLTFSPGSLTLTGAPTEVRERTVHVLTATDEDGDTASLSFAITIFDEPTFEFVVSDRIYREGSVIEPLRLPELVGGNALVSYSLTPAPPAGLVLDLGGRAITGTPTAPQSAREYRWMATDPGGEAATLTFRITVLEDRRPSFDAGRFREFRFRVGSEITPQELPSAAGGDGRLTYAVTPALPPGLTFSPGSLTLTGAPTEVRERTVHVLTATDEDGDTASLSFAITVLEDRRPSFDAGRFREFRFRVGSEITPQELPSAEGGDGRLIYAVTSALPPGLTFSPGSLTLSGTPTEARERTVHVLTATDEDGDTASLSFAVTTIAVPMVMEIRIVSRPAAEGIYRYGEQIELEAEFSEPVAVAGGAGLGLTVGERVRRASLFEVSGAVLRFRYTVGATDRDGDGVSVAANALALGAAGSAGTGSAGTGSVAVDLGHAPLPDQPGHRVDGSPQAVGTLPALTLTLGGEPARVAVEDAFRAAFRYAARSSAPEVAAVSLEGATVVVSAVADGVATVTVTGTNAGGSAEQRFEVTVVTARAEVEVVEHALAGLGRSLLTSASATVGRRLMAGGGGGGPESGGPEGGETETVTFSGLPTDDRLRLEEALRTARNFTLSATRGGRRWTMWGAGDLQSFDGEVGSGSSYAGQPLNSWLGVDVSAGRLLAGVAVSRSTGEMEYAFRDPGASASGDGRLETRLLQAHPYLRWTAGRTRVWGQGGVGRGTAKLSRSVTGATEEGSLRLLVGLAGVRRELGTAGGTALALRADLGGARLQAEGGTGVLDDLSATVYRSRLGLELSRRVGMATPFFEFGGRYDGGSGATGAGLELAGGVRVADARSRIGVEAQGRVLALHSAAGYRESGVSLTARFTPSGGERGLGLEVQPVWGAPAHGAQALWADHELGALRPESGGGAMVARMRYGFGLLSPFTEVTWSEALSRMLRAGVRVGRFGEAVEIELAGSRQATEGGGPSYRFDLYGRIRIP